MPELELSEQAEEALASVWSERETSGRGELAARELAGDEAARKELREAGLIAESSGMVSLTEAGEAEAAAIIRRERLAERLLSDVLGVGEGLMAEAACRFEHVLRRGIDDQVCTLLGHPRACPHGSPIPPGACCRAGANAAGKVVSALADLAPGQTGVIAYIQGRRRDLVPRLLAMGAVPGTPVTLRQRFPSFVLDLGNGQVAVDAETARDIYVQLKAVPPAALRRPRWLERRFRLRRGQSKRER